MHARAKKEKSGLIDENRTGFANKKDLGEKSLSSSLSWDAQGSFSSVSATLPELAPSHRTVGVAAVS